jgi:pyruvate oxidase
MGQYSTPASNSISGSSVRTMRFMRTRVGAKSTRGSRAVAPAEGDANPLLGAGGIFMTLADFLVARLADMGVRHIFGVPGLALLPLLDALARQDRVRWVLMAHENAAAHAAAGESKLAGRLGVCATTSGPGALQPLCGIVDAHLDYAPLLLITGLVPRANLGHWGFQDVDQTALYRAILPQSTTCSTTAQTAALLRSTVGIAMNRGQAAHLAIPVDLLAEAIDETDPVFALQSWAVPKRASSAVPGIETAARTLAQCKKPVIVVGRRAHGAGDAILALARRLDAPVLSSLDGKGVCDESHPHTLGVYGIWGFPGIATAGRVMAEASTVVGFGVDYIKPFITDGRDVQRRDLIQVQTSPAFATLEYESLHTLTGSIPEIAAALAAAVPERPPSGMMLELAADRLATMEDILERLDTVEARNTSLANPLDFLLALNTRLRAEHVFSIDSGSHALWAAMFLRLKHGQRLLVSGRLGTMGFSLPALIGAHQADPDCRPVGIMGDGCFGMTGTELATAVQLKVPLVLVVVNNGVLQNVSAQQERVFGTQLPAIDFVAFARACGARGAQVNGDTDLDKVLDHAFASNDTPFVIDLRCDPNLVAPLSRWEAAQNANRT